MEGYQVGEHPNGRPKIVSGYEGGVEGEGGYFVSHARNRRCFRVPGRDNRSEQRDVLQRGEACARGDPSRGLSTTNIYSDALHETNNRGRDFDKTVKICPILVVEQSDRAESVVPACGDPRPGYERACGERCWFIMEEIDNTVDEFWWKLPLSALAFGLEEHEGHDRRLGSDLDPVPFLGVWTHLK